MIRQHSVVARDLTKERIETERLLLIPVSMEYAKQMFDELTDEITKYMAIYAPKSIDDEKDFINQSLEKLRKGTGLNLMILDKNTKEYLGVVGLKDVDTRTPEPGIWIKKSVHGKKIGREAVAGIKKWAGDNLDFDYLIYPVHKDNIASRKIAESLGGILVSSELKVCPSGKELDEVIYRIPRGSKTS